VFLRAGLDRFGKSRPPPEFDPWTVQPVGSRVSLCHLTRSEMIANDGTMLHLPISDRNASLANYIFMGKLSTFI
jgi:hypothetical protein